MVVRFRVKSANYYELWPFFQLHVFAKCHRVGEDGLGRGHLCHTDLISSSVYGKVVRSRCRNGAYV